MLILTERCHAHYLPSPHFNPSLFPAVLRPFLLLPPAFLLAFLIDKTLYLLTKMY